MAGEYCFASCGIFEAAVAAAGLSAVAAREVVNACDPRQRSCLCQIAGVCETPQLLRLRVAMAVPATKAAILASV